MSAADAFFDTSVLLYLVSADASKADRVEDLLASRGTISVQVLNEFMAVARRKLGMTVDEIGEILGVVRKVCSVHGVSADTPTTGQRACMSAMALASSIRCWWHPP
jgi:predicted nucleic acid-binding protein